MADDRNPKTLQDQIDQNLRRIYENIVEEPLPEKFFDLISELEALDDAPAQDARGGAPSGNDTLHSRD